MLTLRAEKREARNRLKLYGMSGEAAVQRDRDRRFVFVQRDPQSFEARDVALGESNGEIVKILNGLREGEQVVIDGGFILKSELLGEHM